MTWLLGLLGLGGVAGSIAKAFTAVVEAVAPVAGVVLQAIANFLVWYVKEFWKGLQVILSNLSTLTVIALLMATSAYAFRTWDNPKIVRECEAKIEVIKKQVPVKKPAPKVEQPWNPFDWITTR